MPVRVDSILTDAVVVSPAAGEGGEGDAALTPELVKLVAERVYALLLRDLQIERERLRDAENPFGRKGKRT